MPSSAKLADEKHRITFILASSKMGNMTKTGSTGVDRYNLPSAGEENNSD